MLVNLYVVDLQTTLTNLLPLKALSYAVRVLALCVIVYLNSDEVLPAKIFKLGIIAHAMLTSMLNGGRGGGGGGGAPPVSPPPPGRPPHPGPPPPPPPPPPRPRYAIAQSPRTRPSPSRC